LQAQGVKVILNTAKQKMLAGQPAFGFGLALGSTLNAELISRSGIDFVMIDRQHGSWGEDSAIAALVGIHGSSAIPMARVARNDYTFIGRLLDEGVMGMIVPMVDTPEQARSAADSCLLPPQGKRSWGWGRAQLYGADYAERINEELFVAVQLESVEAVKNAEAILSTPGIDGCWTGPSDLALSLGFHPSEMDNRDEHARALASILEACRNTGKIPGIAGRSVDDALNRAGQGFQFITATSDGGLLNSGAAAAVARLARFAD
jgi:4-hydroxy-2-oxoheptanedioate aldolase